jgi:tRNA 2-selenouridine synthase
MVQKIAIQSLHQQLEGRVLIDVRTPAEFAKGHIPGAINLPLFTNEERVVVGTAYKKVSPENALLKGLDFVGVKMSSFIRKARNLAPERRLIVHCWRGGKRSGSMAWLLDMAGFDVLTIEGGYKAYRNLVLEQVEKMQLHLIVVGGRTGTGKTEILHHLRDLGEQILDLEGLAHHKGSAFGGLGELPQPSSEHFDNLLFEQILKLDVEKKIWIENESHGIGTVFITEVFWQKMKAAPVMNVEIPLELRVQRLVTDYAKYPKQELIDVFQRLQKKLGGKDTQTAIEAIEQHNDFTKAAEIALRYYDKTYQFCLDTNISPNIQRLAFDHADMLAIAKVLRNL